jgi:Gram-negative bacterial TonB protein C-terminal
MHTISTEARHNRFYLSMLTSLALQSACLWVVSIVHSSPQPASQYAVIPLTVAKPVFYQQSRIALRQVNVKWSNVRVDSLRTLRGPNLPRKYDNPGNRSAEAAPVIGNPQLGFAAPLTLSLDQPSRPLETDLGDFGAATTDIGSARAGHGTRSGFMESGFGGGGSGKRIDSEPVRILWKPKPAFSEEARNKKIEGDMVIDLIFAADRRIVILHIVQTLGYGLDEMGVHAVTRIRFHPATENGRPVDYPARVRVQFRRFDLEEAAYADISSLEGVIAP